MSKSLADLCIFCIANNLQNINNVGAFLCQNDHEVLLELLCDHDMFTAHNLPYVTRQLLTSRLKNIALRYSRQVNDNLLHCVAQSGCKLKSFTLLECAKVTDKGLSYLLKSQTELEFLHLKLGTTHVNLTDKSLAVLHSPKLTSVKLEALDQVTNSGIITLVKNCPNICMLMVPRCNSLSDGCFQTLVALSKGKLEVLDISGVNLLTDLTLTAIGSGSCPRLRE
ncbi:PREDICTED: F-box/LRR-repeat protein 20-like [Acropora digitifera]|uniref:F-box/LRR-repeat protein 20-like n=1 Tax=Acropora digitifera TaxID=70779 RepID=UPI00077A1C7C|nr:PREDICTED: F-box/LRR-repeat protein 20-like [Acropora digitifera]